MAVAANKRSVMTLFSGPTDIYSHQVRIVLAEKGVSFEIEHVEKDNPPQDLIDLNPNQSVPTLVDRELTLWESRIIMEYLDERFPHPPLMPVYPVARGESRLYMHRIEKDWYTLMNVIVNGSASEADSARKQLREELLAIYARENGAGTMFEPEAAYDEDVVSLNDDDNTAGAESETVMSVIDGDKPDHDDDSSPDDEPPPPRGGRPALRVVK